jgi:hypothetical protein
VDGRQGKALTSPVFIEKSADLEMDGQRGFAKFSLPVDGSIEANRIAEGLSVTPYFEDVGTTRKPKKAAEASAEAAYPPRRAHGTLQPQDESVIVGYYTSALRPQACFGVQPPQAALSTEMKCIPIACSVYTN